MPTVLIWTALPNGIRWLKSGAGPETAHLDISLVITPRIDQPGPATGVLGEPRFADFHDWPSALNVQNSKFTFRFRSGEKAAASEKDIFAIDAQPLMDSSRSVDSHFWLSIFDSKTPIRLLKTDAADKLGPRSFTSYDAATLNEAISAGFVAQIKAFSSAFRGGDLGIRNNPLVAAFLNAADAKEGKVALAEGNPTAVAAARFQSFHARSDAPGFTVEDIKEDPDFHELISALREHPALVRKLGLVLDFRLELSSAQIQQMPNVGRIRVEPSGLNITTPTKSILSWTAFDCTTRVPSTVYGVFHPRRSDPANPDAAGFRSLTKATATFTQHEVDAMSFKLAGLAGHVKESEQPDPDYTARPDPPTRLPALRQGGLALIDFPNINRSLSSGAPLPVETDFRNAEIRSRALEVRLNAVLSAHAGISGSPHQVVPTDDVLFADDGLIRGYRIDTRATSSASWLSLCERASVFQFSGQPLANTPSAIWRPAPDEGIVAKVVFQQSGLSKQWRISPYLWIWDGWSLVVPRPGKPVDADGKASEIDQPAVRNIKYSSSVPPHTLPRKRFGTTYEFRIRTVDLAGNSWTKDEASALMTGLGITVATVTNFRIEPARSPALIQDSAWLEGEKGDTLVVRTLDSTKAAESIRQIAPPDASEQLAEEHGAFDALTDQQAYTILTTTDRGQFPAYAPGSLDRLRDRTGRLRVPYLPDPLVGGAVLSDIERGNKPVSSDFRAQTGIPGGAREIQLTSTPLRLRAGAPKSPVTVEAKNGEILVSVPAGERFKGKLSASIRESKISAIWLSYWTDKLGDVATTLGLPSVPAIAKDTSTTAVQLKAAMQMGEEDVVTPSREIDFVHATQRPIDKPTFGPDIDVQRALGNATAYLVDAKFLVHVASTGRLNFVARWEDLVDIPGEPSWRVVKGALAPFGFDLSETDSSELGTPGKPESYWADAPTAGNSLVKQKRKNETKRRQPPTAHTFPDTKYREVSYEVHAISRFASFMPKAISDDQQALSHVVSSQPLPVLNSSPPAAPVVRYILPTFRHDTQGATREHFPGGLRIYLERPWLSSGRGEKLAIVVYAAHLTKSPPELSRFVTEWGFNPRKLSGAPLNRPVLEDFPTAEGKVVAQTITLYSGEKPDPQLGGQPPPPITTEVSLATYDVTLDGPNDVLYCDIDVNPGPTYFPCLRLAIARFQAMSLDEARLSPVVLADFIQLVPGRSLSIAPPQLGKRRITVTGVSYVDTEFGLTTSEIEAYLERRSPSGPSQPLWEIIPDSKVALVPERVGAETMTWTGNITQPPDHSWRIILLEYEYFAIDQNAEVRPGEELTRSGKRVSRRLIFSDAIEIN
ncbi:hypothetical protein [Bradyrhizobium sp. SZCCHNRI1073]|uniref:hypothetical protein n=1 Tax=Bradyrhizobium sp. SZCCHNRI1073 TaxID=3057280 RepID=UPI00291648AE|nr:hypothetical protein [Bradyrhizobium sp. SZCCHNRI1073]